MSALRIRQLQEAMAGSDVDAIVLRLAENVLLATGYWQQIGGLGIAVVPSEGAPSLLVPEYEQDEARARFGGDIRAFPAIRFDGPAAPVAIAEILADLARAHGAVGGVVGFEGSFDAVAPPRLDGEPSTIAAGTQELIRRTFATERLADVTPALEQIRLVKTEADLEALRVVNEIACLGLDAFKEHAAPGRTEAEVAAEVTAAIIARGHGYKGTRTVRAYATVWSGPETAAGWQYFLHRDRKIEDGDVVMLELGTVADGYWSDHTRTVVAGTATDAQREAFAAMKSGMDAAFAAARPGATGHEVDAASRRAVAAGGFEQFPHHTGHGTGFRYHESRPQLIPGSDHVLQAGMVIVAEPGIYEPGLGGIRWEDDAVVTESGAIRLAETSYGLD